MIDIVDYDYLSVCTGAVGGMIFNAHYTPEKNNNTVGEGYVQRLALWDKNSKIIFQMHGDELRVPPANEDIRYAASEALKEVNLFLHTKFKEDK